ncbi:MAG: hypothetical protein KDK53_00900 [Maritimibacter sp.]|nr:hypothetical protein [Maritimibacter sp.]
MRRVLAAAAGLVAFSGGIAVSGPFDGVYVPHPGQRAADQAGCADLAILIAEDRLRYFDVSCTLANPVQIREMDALLFDGQCTLDGTAKAGRVLIRRTASGDVALVTPFMDVRLAGCAVAG